MRARPCFEMLLAVILLAPAPLRAANPVPAQPIPDSKNQIIRLTDEGIVPRELRMRAEDSIVFFLNDSKDALATLELDFAGKTTHCATKNMQILTGDKVRSTRPIGPRDFASACFHERGTYPLTVFGLRKNPKGINGVIIVE